MRREFIWCDEGFYNIVSKRIIRDKRTRKEVERHTNKKFYGSFGEATKALGDELRRLGW